MMTEFSDVKSSADKKLKEFIEMPSQRSRRATPDLGDMIQYLTISDTYKWDDIKAVYVPEMIRRAALRLEGLELYKMESPAKLAQFWFQQLPTSGQVTMFNKMFLDVMRPSNMTTDQVKDMYDEGWGSLPDDKIQKLKDGFHEIMSIKTMKDVIKYLGFELDDGAVGELLLWALDNYREANVVYEEIPKSAGDRVEEMVIRNELWKESTKNPPPGVALRPSCQGFEQSCSSGWNHICI